MKRIHNRTMRHNAEMSPVAEHNSAYTGKHEIIAEIFADVAELFAEVCNDLELTADFIAETVAENAARLRKIARKLRLPKLPETFSGYRWRSFVSPGLFDMPIIAEGGGKYDVAWNWRG